MKSAIVGCGRIADQHAAAIRRIRGSEIVAVCDREGLMARQLADRFAIERWFTDLDSMLETMRPDVVHITTSPQSHYELGRRSLEAGCHVYVEKPFTVNLREAECLICLAQETNQLLTVGHNLQFTEEWRRLRKLVADGYLGGPPVHMESYYSYNLQDPTNAQAVLRDPNHWVRRLPGQLLQNVISHGIGRIVEFLESDNPEVFAQGFRSPLLEKSGERELIDELRVLLSDTSGTTAYFTFTCRFNPPLNQFRIYGPSNSIQVDNFHRVLIRSRAKSYKSYLNYFIPPVRQSLDLLKNSVSNIGRFITMNFHDDSGMKGLIEDFYHSAEKGLAPPIPYRDILVTTRIMDEVFFQLSGRQRVDQFSESHPRLQTAARQQGGNQ